MASGPITLPPVGGGGGGGGSGDVVGPVSSTTNAVALFSSGSGKAIKNSTITWNGTTLYVPGGILVDGDLDANSNVDGVDIEQLSLDAYAAIDTLTEIESRLNELETIVGLPLDWTIPLAADFLVTVGGAYTATDTSDGLQFSVPNVGVPSGIFKAASFEDGAKYIVSQDWILGEAGYAIVAMAVYDSATEKAYGFGPCTGSGRTHLFFTYDFNAGTYVLDNPQVLLSSSPVYFHIESVGGDLIAGISFDKVNIVYSYTFVGAVADHVGFWGDASANPCVGRIKAISLTEA